MYIQLHKLKEAIIKGKAQLAMYIAEEVLKNRIGVNEIIEIVINPTHKELCIVMKNRGTYKTDVLKAARVMLAVNALLTENRDYS